MGLIRFLLIAFIAYYLIRLAVRLILPFVLKYIVKKTHGNTFQWQTGKQQRQKQEGEVTIDYPQSQKDENRNKGKDGEYVDFEEVK